MIDALLWIGVGFAVGWLVFERPQVATQLIADVKRAFGK